MQEEDLLWYIFIKSARTKTYQKEVFMDYSIIARKLRERIAVFSGELSRGLPKVARRFTGEMLYGIQASRSVVLTKIGRTLQEETSIKKVQERLSRQLARRALGRKMRTLRV